MSGRRFGFECELTSGAQSVIYALSQAGVAETDNLHNYHCHCADCRANDVEAVGGPLFRGQTDCTVDGEIISSILTHGTANADRAFEVLASTLSAKRADVGTDAGFHVHVDRTDLDNAAKLRVYRMFMRYQDDALAELASAREPTVRSYNRKLTMAHLVPNAENGYYIPNFGTLFPDRRPVLVTCNGRPWSPDVWCCSYCDRDSPSYTRLAVTYEMAQAEWDRLYGPDAQREQPGDPEERFWTDDTFVATAPPKGCWLNGNGAANSTIEFRLWNATRVEWRMRLAVGVSVAMVDAAKAGVNVKQDDERPLEQVLDPYLTDDTWAALIRQRSYKDVA